jgi:predicted nucleic acid-binding protein
MLLDSNIVIYAADPAYPHLEPWILAQSFFVSAITRVEVLGFPNLTPEDRRDFERFFARAPMLAVTDAVIEAAIALRQTRRMKLGDSLIAGTALTHQLPLATHNTADFNWIPGLTLVDPLVRT